MHDGDLALATRYRDDVDTAIRHAFAHLDNARDRNLLRLYYADRAGLGPLAQMYGVDSPTVSRWLVSLRWALVADVEHRLGEALSIRAEYAHVEGLMRVVRCDLDVMLARLLK